MFPCFYVNAICYMYVKIILLSLSHSLVIQEAAWTDWLESMEDRIESNRIDVSL